ncbi:MAG: glycosyltransferase [Phenylobacterium sp.]|uniref:glycosyltransferase n=1 Tax=Phenylobacterium sp. TaxID=1871053 RepID=UPI0039195ACE
MRVAIIHYWLVGMRGGERVLERLLSLYPQADIFTHVYDPSSVSDVIRRHKVVTSFIQDLPFATRLYQRYLPLMPRALESFDLTGYDLVISSESGPAKGVIPPPTSKHVCYCHSPMRYLWDHHAQYGASAGALAKLGMGLFFNGLRIWDVTSSARVDAFAANSNFVRQRIEKYYRREAEVIHPPVDVSLFKPREDVEDRYLWVGQLTSYKRPDLAVDAFNRLKLPLLVVGAGEMEADLRRKAGPNITFVQRMGFDDLRAAYARARALVFTPEEDFGIVPVEAIASGRPVLAYGRGGALDTVSEGVSGLFFQEPTVDSLIEGVERLEQWLPEFDQEASRATAARFAPEHFDRAFQDLVQRA